MLLRSDMGSTNLDSQAPLDASLNIHIPKSTQLTIRLCYACIYTYWLLACTIRDNRSLVQQKSADPGR